MKSYIPENKKEVRIALLFNLFLPFIAGASFGAYGRHLIKKSREQMS